MKALTDFAPCAERAQHITTGVRAKLQGSLSYLLEVSGHPQTDKLDTALQVIDGITQAPKISGYLYALNTQLLSAIQEENEAGIHHVVDEIAAGGFFYDEINIQNFEPSLIGENKRNAIVSCIYVEKEKAGTHNPAPLDRYTRTVGNVQRVFDALPFIDAATADEAMIYLNEAFIFDSDKITGGSSFNLLGTIYLNCQTLRMTWIDMLERIVHEAAHLHLFSLSTQDALIENDLSERYASPLRKDPRPMPGVYHAVFVLGRVINIFNLIQKKFVLAPDDAEQVTRELALFNTYFQDGYHVVQKHARLTDLGRAIIKDTAAHTQKWLS